MRSVARINAYYAIVDAAGQKIIDWQAQAKEPLTYIYHHADARLLVCQESPDDQDDCSVVREIDPQFDMNSLGLKPTPVGQTASRLIGVLDQLFHMDLQTGTHHYGRAHAIRLAYLSLYLGEISQLSYRDTFLLIYCSFLADLGHQRPDDTSLTGLLNFYRVIAAGEFNLNKLSRMLHIITASVTDAFEWTRTDTKALVTLLTESKGTPTTDHLADYFEDGQTLEQIRFGKLVDLSALHLPISARLLYLSREELALNPD